MPKNSMMRSPATALTAMTTKALIAATRIVAAPLLAAEAFGEVDEERQHADRIDDRQERDERLQDVHGQS